MRKPQETVRLFACPACRAALPGSGDFQKLTCPKCQKTYSFARGVWNFLTENDYTRSFGFQWNRHPRTQLDKFNGLRISYARFYDETNWRDIDLKDKLLLEIGSGPGRFTEIALTSGAQVFSLEASEAIYANAANNDHDNLCLLRASLYEQPFLEEIFDFLICFGVIQHTPDVQRSFKELFRFLKKGGQFSVDVYASPIAYLHPRHLLRPFTRKMKSEDLYSWTEKLVRALLPVSNALLAVPAAGEFMARLVPVANFRKSLYLTDPAQIFEWSLLDTFDWYSPAYEQPQAYGTLKNWCEEMKFKTYEIVRHRGIYVIRGEK